MLTQKRARAVIGVAAVVWAVLLIVQGSNVKVSFLKPFSGVVGITILVLGIYDRWLWKFGPLRRLQKQPLLHGTWKGILQTTWQDPATGVAPGPIEVYMVVRQSCSTVSFSMLTAESGSRTVSAALEDAESGAWVLSGTYLNTPKLVLQHRSRVHRGSAVMEVHEGTSMFIEGSYWTDRDSKGSLRFDRHVVALPTHFEQARKEFA